MAKNNKQASAYAGRAKEGLAEFKKYKTGSQTMNELDISVGTICKDKDEAPKREGIKIRGTGAATKGTMARGPMA